MDVPATIEEERKEGRKEEKFKGELGEKVNT
jgi:hypothetical protein